MLKGRFIFVYMKQLLREGTEVSKITYNTTYKMMTVLIYITSKFLKYSCIIFMCFLNALWHSMPH